MDVQQVCFSPQLLRLSNVENINFLTDLLPPTKKKKKINASAFAGAQTMYLICQLGTPALNGHHCPDGVN